MINLGGKVKDSVNGFTGIVTSEHRYLNGCVRFGVQPDKLDKDGKPYEAQVIDEQQLSVVKAVKPKAVPPRGGPRNEPSRQIAPTR